MTVTKNPAFATRLDVPIGRGARRLPINDVGVYLNELPEDARAGLRALGELLVGVTQRPVGAESVYRFTARCLGVTDSGLLVDDTGLLATAALLAEVGSGRYRATPAEGMYL